MTYYKVETDEKIENLTELELAYLSGLFDGEGCICIQKYTDLYNRERYKAFMEITMTDEGPIQWIAEKVGGSRSIDKKLKNVACKVGYHWQLNARQSGRLLERMMPYLKVKGPQAKILQEYVKTMGLPTGRPKANNGKLQGSEMISEKIYKRRNELRLKMRELNKKGRKND